MRRLPYASMASVLVIMLALAGVHSAFGFPGTRKLLQAAAPQPYVRTPDILYLNILANANTSAASDAGKSTINTAEHVAEDYSLLVSYTLYCSSELQKSEEKASLKERAALLLASAAAYPALAGNKTLSQTFNSTVQANLAALQGEAKTADAPAAAPAASPALDLPGLTQGSSNDLPTTILRGFTIPLPGNLGDIKIPSINPTNPLADVKLPEINLTGLGLDIELPTITRRPLGSWDKNQCLWFDAFAAAHARYLLGTEGLMAAYLLNITQGNAAQAAAAREGATRLLVEALACDWEDAFWSARKSFIDLYLPHLSRRNELVPSEWTLASVAALQEHSHAMATAVAEAAGPQAANAIMQENEQLFKQAQATVAAKPLSTLECKASVNQTVELITNEVSYNGTIGLLKLRWPGDPAGAEEGNPEPLQSVFYSRSPVAVQRPETTDSTDNDVLSGDMAVRVGE